MRINSISGITYRVADIDKTVEFYESIGFRGGNGENDEVTCYVNWFWVRFVAADDGENVTPDTAPTLYLKGNAIDDYYGELLANDFAPVGEPQKQRSGRREFLLRDPDGYTLAFFTKVANRPVRRSRTAWLRAPWPSRPRPHDPSAEPWSRASRAAARLRP